jgi:GntR family transcriptional regulator
LTIKKEMAKDVLDRFIRGMQDLGFQDEDILAAVAENIRTKDGE